MKSFFSIIMAMLFVLNSEVGLFEQEDGSIELPPPDCFSVYTFINDNFNLFVEKFNEEIESDEKWMAEGIDDVFPITVKSSDNQEYALLLDFSRDDGYAILGDDYLMFDFRTSGESPFAGIEADELFYSIFGVYYYRIGENYFSVDDTIISSEDDWLNAEMGRTYDGQDSGETGCGCINDPDRFVKAKYGTGWTLDRSNSLNMEAHRQTRLSCYKQNLSSTRWCSEGNCWVISAYHVLQYYADKKFSEMPKSTSKIEYNPQSSEPEIYSDFFDESGNNISGTFQDGEETLYNWELNEDLLFPELWAKTREYTNDKFGKINDGTIWETEEIVEEVADSYNNCRIKTETDYLWLLHFSDIEKKIDNGDVFLWSTLNGTYGSHTMAGCGYRVYKKTTTFWFISTTKTKFFIEIRDGWSDSPRYYDMSGFIEGGIGALIYCQAITKPAAHPRRGCTNEAN